MSTKAAEHYGDNRERVICKICCGTFVAHKYYEYKFFKMPNDVCIWCYSRGFGKKEGLYYRWETMERALRAISAAPCLKPCPHCNDEGIVCDMAGEIIGPCDCVKESCKCLTCFAKRTMDKVDGSRPERPYGRADKIAQVATPIAEGSGMEARDASERSDGQDRSEVPTPA